MQHPKRTAHLVLTVSAGWCYTVFSLMVGGTDTVSSAMGTRVRKVHLVMHSALISGRPYTVEMYVDGELVHTSSRNASGTTDPLADMMHHMQGYMTTCTHARVCVGSCDARESVPFTFTVQQEWSNE
jgi:hypothetical protein